MQLVDDQRHLLAGVHQQRAQADRIGVHLHRLRDDRFGRDLFAQVDDGIAVIGQDRLDQVLADVVHIAVNRSDHHLPFGGALLALQELFDMRYSFLHHLCRLEHEWQDQLARAEFVAHFLHRREQDGVQNPTAVSCWETAPVLAQDFINIGFHALFVTMEDPPVQALLGGHLLGWIGLSSFPRQVFQPSGNIR